MEIEGDLAFLNHGLHLLGCLYKLLGKHILLLNINSDDLCELRIFHLGGEEIYYPLFEDRDWYLDFQYYQDPDN